MVALEPMLALMPQDVDAAFGIPVSYGQVAEIILIEVNFM
jgi:hypothetical protein